LPSHRLHLQESKKLKRHCHTIHESFLQQIFCSCGMRIIIKTLKAIIDLYSELFEFSFFNTLFLEYPFLILSYTLYLVYWKVFYGTDFSQIFFPHTFYSLISLPLLVVTVYNVNTTSPIMNLFSN
jgi:hypothetical protein